MAHDSMALLEATGFDERSTEQYKALEQQGRYDECLRLLRCRRCELVEALHEAQRPIDIIDWAIHDLQNSVN